MTVPGFTLDARGVTSSRTVVSEHIDERAVTLSDADEPGFVVLRVGTIEFSDLWGGHIQLDAAGCRHLARLLEAAADALSGHRETDQVPA